MGSGYVPNGVLELVVITSVELPDPATDAGLNAAVAPAGRPLRVRFTVLLNPPVADMFTVLVALSPGITVCELGVVEMEKSGVKVPRLQAFK